MSDPSPPTGSRPEHASDTLPPFRKAAELQGSDLEERQSLVAFVLELCKSILQTSVYTPDHPQARAGVDRACTALEEVIGLTDEYTFMVSHVREDEGMALEGVFQEPVPLLDLVPGAAGESFDRKLHGFCKRNRVVSFSIKNTIDADEFHRFIGVFTEFFVAAESNQLLRDYGQQEDFEDFTLRLLQRGVVNVPVVMESDLVESKRRIPWRVRVALSRMKKDLRSIPIYANATAMELQQAKLRLLRDILRPLRKQAHLRDLFLNLDLITTSVEEFKEVDLEPDLMDALSVDRVVALGKSLISEKQRIDKAPNLIEEQGYSAELPATIERQLGMVGARIGEAKDLEDVADLLRHLYLSKVVPLEALPKSMQDHIRIEQWTAAYLGNSDDFLHAAEMAFSPEEYRGEIAKVMAIFPNLIRLKKYAETSRLLDLVRRHREKDGYFEGRRALIDEALSVLGNDEAVDLLVHEMRTETAIVREYLKKLFVLLGPTSIPTLVKVLTDDLPKDVVNAVGLTLVAMGQPAVPALVEILESGGLSNVTATTIVNVLGELGGKDVVLALGRYARHPRPLVRETALRALDRADPISAGPALLSALDDRDPRVVLRAMQVLEKRGFRREVYARRLARFVDPPETPAAAGDAGSEGRAARPAGAIHSDVLLASIREMARLGNQDLHELGTVEERLLGCFARYGQNKMARLLRRPRDPEAERVRSAVCETLAKIGTDLAAERLEDQSDEPSPVVRRVMAEAVAAIDRRLHGGAEAPRPAPVDAGPGAAAPAFVTLGSAEDVDRGSSPGSPLP